ncbi:tetrahydrofolate synthase [Ascoidea rubescens DSM 1968]|uniref:Folylpolyglutamate synthase n=1 Tax=Ascoidea rubescens DSM 1968 TaxID=1344418 RepID=A0A1D2VIT6_9ASCO|nr:FolC bifunctional protein [Ascoidea rubescens DSM 1968]ODV61546.1 FolC bifunctional protein [Ascoidea rubescens DSM 1968]
MSSHTYTEAIDVLNSLQSNFAYIQALKQSGVKKTPSSMAEMKSWLHELGYNPTDFNKLNIIHITGTKGKGSTCAFTSSILQQYSPKHLHKIGLYTSPHLKSVRERISINGSPIPEKDFTRYFFQIWNVLKHSETKLSYFKFLTLLSFHVFMKEGVDTAIYEVGVGGEYDSTNVIHTPTCTGVTSLGIDHTTMLGNTISEIAWNKSGIFKKNSNSYTIVGQPTEGLNVLKERAKERESPLSIVPIHPQLSSIKLGLAGDFQKYNASLSIALATQHLKKLKILPNHLNTSLSLPNEFKIGLEKTQWLGRCQTLFDLAYKNLTWYLDGAHTKESIEASANWFKNVTNQTDKKKIRILLFNQQKRDAALLVTHLHHTIYPTVNFDYVLFTTNVTWASGNYSIDLVSINTDKKAVDNLEVQNSTSNTWKSLDEISQRLVFHDIESSIKFVNDIANNNPDSQIDVYVNGSLHLVGGFLTVYDSMKENHS